MAKHLILFISLAVFMVVVSGCAHTQRKQVAKRQAKQQIQKWQGEENHQNSQTPYRIPPGPPSSINLLGGN